MFLLEAGGDVGYQTSWCFYATKDSYVDEDELRALVKNDPLFREKVAKMLPGEEYKLVARKETVRLLGVHNYGAALEYAEIVDVQNQLRGPSKVYAMPRKLNIEHLVINRGRVYFIDRFIPVRQVKVESFQSFSL